MVPYFGSHSCKMVIRDKPIKFDFKMWMLFEASGYSYHMSIFSGRDQGYQPLGTRAGNQMLQVV